MSEKFNLGDVLKKLDEFEEDFVKDPTDDSLLTTLKFSGKVITSGDLTEKELIILQQRLIKIGELFSQKKREIEIESQQALYNRDNVQKYIKTSNIKR